MTPNPTPGDPAERGGGLLALTMGEPAGIGPDITLGAWMQRASARLPAFVVFGSRAALGERAVMLGLSVPIETVATADAARAVWDAGRLPVIDIALARPVEAGKPDPGNGAAVIAAIERATADVMAGRACALVTNPIAKSVLYAAGFAHPGHTEFLAALAGKADGGATVIPVMMLVAPQLRVVPLTIHIPLADVPRAISGVAIETAARIMAASLVLDFGIARPRIAVAGLNPHAGESGGLGREEIEIITPAIAALAAQGLDITGPLSADTMFHAAARARYDAALCMYHDQALIPIKTLAFDDGVNVTLGLPFVRTSPDHGTAFDIAGHGHARPASLIAALRLAAAMAARRRAGGATSTSR